MYVLEIIGIKLEQVAVVERVTDGDKIGQRWSKQDEADDKRNDQPCEAFADELTGRSGFEGEPGACSCKEKEKRHAPLRAEDDQHHQAGVLLSTLDMPVELIENICAMRVEDSQHGQHTQPVEIVESFSLYWSFISEWSHSVFFVTFVCPKRAVTLMLRLPNISNFV